MAKPGNFRTAGKGVAYKQSRTVLGMIISILLGAIPGSAFRPSEYLTQQARRSLPPVHTNLRYVIVTNRLLHSGRLVFILLDKQSFSEQNLREVFRLVSKRFPKPDQLWITAFTSLEQLPTPEEEDYMVSAPEDSLPFYGDVDKYPSANYTRLKGSESFIYSMGDGQQKKTVVISEKTTSPKSHISP